MTRKRKTNHEIDIDEEMRACATLKDNHHFKILITMCESMREDVIRQLQTKSVIESTNRHFMMSGKLEAIDELLDKFYTN